MRQTSRHRRRVFRDRLGLEALEARVVLDSGLGTAAAWLSSNTVETDSAVALPDPAEPSQPSLARFTSAEELRQYLIDAAVAQYEGLFGQPAWRGWWWDDLWSSGTKRPSLDSSSNTTSESGTNVQVEGVDEGDFVKTDGKYLYQLVDQELLIIDIQDPTQLRITARVLLNSRSVAREIYVNQERLTVISQSQTFFPDDPVPWARIAASDATGLWQPEPATRPEPTVEVAVYDIHDRSAPQLLETTEVGGILLETRAIDSFVYLVTQEWVDLPAPDIQCKEDASQEPTGGTAAGWQAPSLGLLLEGIDPGFNLPWFDPAEKPNCVYESRGDYIQRLADLTLDGLLPTVRVLDGTGSEISSGWLIDPDATYRVAGKHGLELVSVVTLDFGDDQPGPSDSVAVFQDYVSEVYASQSNLYLCSTQWDDSGTATTIVQLELDGVHVLPKALGSVPGQLLNQFAMDEYRGVLRVATTQGWGDAATNQLYVLSAHDGLLEVVGQLAEDLAPGERLFAARFLGDQAFLATFRQIDPLFAIDLSDPTAPQMVGELHIPGFSLYLHPVAPGYIVGLGRDADAETGRQLDPQLTLFDVSDLSAPQAVATFVFATEAEGWAHSEAFWDHHAISYFPQYQTLVVPLESGGWQPLDIQLANGLSHWEPRREFWVFQIDTAGGEKAIHLQGTIAHDSPVRRSFEVAGNLFTVATDDVQVHPILAPATELDQISVVPLATDDDHTLVRFRFEPTDRDGNPLRTIEVGQPFFLNVLVQDLRENAAGVFGAYLDAHFDAALAEIVGPITYGEDYGNGVSGRLDIAGCIDEVGAFASTERLGPDARLLARIPFVANAVGQLVFTADAADEAPAHEVTIYDSNQAVATPALEFGDALLSIIDGFHNAAASTDANGDGNTSAIDALVVINFLNRHGSQPLATLRGLALDTPVGEAATRQVGIDYFYLDINDDGHVSPVDVLQIINRLNAPVDVAAEGEGLVVSIWPRSTDGPTVASDHNDVVGNSRGRKVEAVSAGYPMQRAADQLSDSTLSERHCVAGAQDLDSVLDEIARGGHLRPERLRDALFAEL